MNMNQPIKQVPASFRDPSGFVYQQNGTVYRFVSSVYKEHYDLFVASGLKEQLQKASLLLPFEETTENHTGRTDWYKTLLPQQIPFLNYAWEWSFEQLKDAALTTLRISRKSLKQNMILKDATHLNIQFVKGRPMFIDHLSFEQYKDGSPWIAYRQFCECFLNPLLLASYCKLEPQQLFTAWPNGISADVTARLLPFKCRFHTSLALHVFLPARMAKNATGTKQEQPKTLPRKGLEQILDNLETVVQSLTYKPNTVVWENYYSETILSKEYLTEKKKVVQDLLQQVNYETVLDLGANEGEFALLCREDAQIVAVDNDSACIQELYKKLKTAKKKHILPLVADLTQPSPARGWMNEEQGSFLSRAKADLGLALALIHHLCIGKNLPLIQVAQLLVQCTQLLIIEFVPKNDPKVQELLRNRADVFPNYNEEEFERDFETCFQIKSKVRLTTAGRTLYLMSRK